MTSPAAQAAPPSGAHPPAATHDADADAVVRAKRALRRQVRRARDAMPEHLRAALSARMAEHLLAWIAQPSQADVRAAGVALFCALGSEADPAPMRAGLHALGVPVHLPRVLADGPGGPALLFARVGPEAALERSAQGIWEPPAELCGPVGAHLQLGAIVVPGLAFDAAGHRLGWGQGLYDRALQAFTGRTIGMGFAQQHGLAVPHAAHDVPVGALVHEHGLRWLADA